MPNINVVTTVILPILGSFQLLGELRLITAVEYSFIMCWVSDCYVINTYNALVSLGLYIFISCR